MLVKNEAPASNNSSRSNRRSTTTTYDKSSIRECDIFGEHRLASILSSAFVVPTTSSSSSSRSGSSSNRSSSNNISSSNRQATNGNEPLPLHNKRRRLDSIINNLNQSGNVQQQQQQPVGLTDGTEEIGGGANQVGDISSTTSTNTDSHTANIHNAAAAATTSAAHTVFHSSSLITRPLAIQLNHKRKENTDNYRSIGNSQFSHSSQQFHHHQAAAAFRNSEQSNAINLSYYDRKVSRRASKSH